MGNGLNATTRTQTRGAIQFRLQTLLVGVALCAAVLALAARVHVALGVLGTLALVYGWGGSLLRPGFRIVYHLAGLLCYCAAVAVFDMFAGLMISVKAVVAAAAPVALFSYPFLLRPRRQLHSSIAVVGVAVMVATYFIAWNSRKPFLQDLYRVEVGMTPAEVEAIMGRYILGTGWPNPGMGGELQIRSAIVFRHSDEAAYDSDWGIVAFRDGRVVKVEFSAD